MDYTEKLLAIKQELEQISQRLDDVFPKEHPLYEGTFENISAATYYLREVCYQIESAITIVEEDGADSEQS